MIRKMRFFVFFTILIVSGWAFSANSTTQHLQRERAKMITLFKSIGLNNPAMIEAFSSLDREKFAFNRELGTHTNVRSAYVDYPLAIGYGQTISSPRMMAIMTEYAKISPEHRVLEIGTGSGYQGAVLAKMAKEVYTIEIVKPLGEWATKIFKQENLNNVKNKVGDGYFGWKEHAPFDRILVTCATNHIPPALISQLKKGGMMLIPVGHPYRSQVLKIVSKDMDGKIRTKNLLAVKFVPMTGRALQGVR